MVRTTRVGRSPRGRNPSIRVQIPASPCLIFRMKRNQAELFDCGHACFPSCPLMPARFRAGTFPTFVRAPSHPIAIQIRTIPFASWDNTDSP